MYVPVALYFYSINDNKNSYTYPVFSIKTGFPNILKIGISS